MTDSVPEIFSYVAVVLPDFGRKSDHVSSSDDTTGGAFRSTVVEHYPKESSGMAFPPNVGMFCTPDGVQFKTEKLAPQTHTFQLTNIDGRPYYGFCRTYWYLATPEQIGEATAILEERGQPAPSPSSYLPGCLLILSKFPYYTRFSQLLAAADSRAAYNSAALPSIAYDIFNLMCPAPLPGHELTLDFNGATVSFPQPTYEQLPLADTTYLTIISRLSPRNIIATFNAIINEAHVVFVGDEAGAVSSAVLDFCSLLYPMFWSFQIFPLLPRSIAEFLDAPQPYICGITRATMESVPKSTLNHHFIVDIDNNKITHNIDPEMHFVEMPPRYVLRLCAVLHGKVQPFSLLHPNWKDDTPRTYKDIVSTEKEIGRHKVTTASIKTLDTLFSSNSEWDFDIDFRRDATSEEAKQILAQLALEAGQKLQAVDEFIPDQNEVMENEVEIAEKRAVQGGHEVIDLSDEYESESEFQESDGEYQDCTTGTDTTSEPADEIPAPTRPVAAPPAPADKESRVAAGRAALSAPFFAGAHVSPNADLSAIPELLSHGAVNPVGIRRGFISVFTSMLKSFWSFVRVDAAEQNGNLDQLFNKQGFLLLSKEDIRPYVEHFLGSQMFAFFIQDRVVGDGNAHSASLVLGPQMGEQNDFFDAAVITALNRKQGQRKQRLVASLATNAYRRCRRRPTKWNYRRVELPPETPGKSFTVDWIVLTNADRQADATVLQGAVQRNMLDEVTFEMPRIHREPNETQEGFQKRQAQFKKAHAQRPDLSLPKGSHVEIPIGETTVRYPTEYPLIVYGPDESSVIELSFLTSRDRRLWLGAIKARVSDADMAQRVVIDRLSTVFKLIMENREAMFRKNAAAFNKAH